MKKRVILTNLCTEHQKTVKTQLDRNFGKLKPGGKLKVRAEIVTDDIGEFEEEVQIDVDSKISYTLPSKGTF